MGRSQGRHRSNGSSTDRERRDRTHEHQQIVDAHPVASMCCMPQSPWHGPMQGTKVPFTELDWNIRPRPHHRQWLLKPNPERIDLPHNPRVHTKRPTADTALRQRVVLIRWIPPARNVAAWRSDPHSLQGQKVVANDTDGPSRGDTRPTPAPHARQHPTEMQTAPLPFKAPSLFDQSEKTAKRSSDDSCCEIKSNKEPDRRVSVNAGANDT